MEVQVVFKAMIDGLTSGLKTATNEVKHNTDEMKGSFEKLGDTLVKFKSAFITLAALGGATAIFKKSIDATVEWSMEINKLSKVLNVSTQAASTWGVALHTLGVSEDTLAGIVQRLQTRVASGGAAFNKWGIEIKNAHGGALPMSQIIENLATKYQSLSTDQEKNTMLTQLAGRGWMALLPIMRLTAERMAEAKKEAEELGLVVGPEGVAKSREYSESMRKLNLIFMAMENTLGKELMPTVTGFTNYLGGEGMGVVSGFADVIKVVVSALYMLKIGVEMVVLGLYGFISTLIQFNVTLAKVAYDIATMDYKGAVAHAKEGATAIKNEWSAVMETIQASVDRTQKAMDAMWGSGSKKERKMAGEGNTQHEAGPMDEDDAAAKAAAKARMDAEIGIAKDLEDTKTAIEKNGLKEREAGLAEYRANIKANADAEIATAEDAYAKKKDLIEQDFLQGKITEDQKTAALQIALLDREAAVKASYLKMQVLEKTGSLGYQKIEADKVKLARKTEDEITALTIAELKERQKKEEDVAEKRQALARQSVQVVTGSLAQSIKAGESFSESMNNMATGVKNYAIDMAAEQLTNYLTGLITKKTTTVTTEQAMAAAHAEVSAATLAVDKSTNFSEAMSMTSVWATRAASAVAGISVVGPALALAAAATAMEAGAAIAATGAAGGAAKGYAVPWNVNPMTQLHGGEHVIPRAIAEKYESGAPGRGGKGGLTVNISAMDGQDAMRVMRRQLPATLKRLQRNGVI